MATPHPDAGPINTAGAEDSPFITPDGETFLFFFTRDAQIPPEQQLLDDVTGLYLSHRVGDRWSEPSRLVLQDIGRLSLDGSGFLQGETLWSCSARAGNLREIDLWPADLHGDRASNWRNAGHEIHLEIGTGEMHLSADGQALYFHAPRPGAADFDLYVSRRSGEGWARPSRWPRSTPKRAKAGRSSPKMGRSLGLPDSPRAHRRSSARGGPAATGQRRS
jgi:hypothetical protein